MPYIGGEMLKILLVALLAGLVSSCAMEEPNDSGVLVDPNSETEVPDWITPAYLDLNKDGVVDILDLVIHSKFFGDVETEEVVAESCPAGQYRKMVTKVVGYHKDWEGDIPTDSSGRRLKERHTESCAYQYPNWRQFDTCVDYNYGRCREGGWASKSGPPDKTCLVACAQGSSALCSQTEKMYSHTCELCPPAIGKRIRYAEYIQSDDPTKCQRGKKNEIQYRFAHGDDFYVYALVRFTVGANFDIASEKAGARYRGPRSLEAAIRILVTEDGKRVKKMKIKTLKPDANKNSSRDQLEVREVFNATYTVGMAGDKEMIGWFPLDDIGEEKSFIKIKRVYHSAGYRDDNSGVRYDASITYPGQTVIRHDLSVVLVGNLLEKSAVAPTDKKRRADSHLHQGIQIGKPAKINADFSDSYIYNITFIDNYLNDTAQNYYGRYEWNASSQWSDAYSSWDLPSKEVRAKYFPEDIDE